LPKYGEIVKSHLISLFYFANERLKINFIKQVNLNSEFHKSKRLAA